MGPPRWRWDNVPLPEPHLAAVAAAVLAHVIVPARLPIGRHVAGVVGWPAVAAGVGLAAWGVMSASTAGVMVDRPSGLVTTGAYAIGRNPMYQGWTLAVLGIGLVTRSFWVLLAAVAASTAAHRAVLDEEAGLYRAFGADFATYRERTPRYVTPAGAVAGVVRMIRGRSVIGGDRDL